MLDITTNFDNKNEEIVDVPFDPIFDDFQDMVSVDREVIASK
jgi:hypothetical protein